MGFGFDGCEAVIGKLQTIDILLNKIGETASNLPSPLVPSQTSDQGRSGPTPRQRTAGGYSGEWTGAPPGFSGFPTDIQAGQTIGGYSAYEGNARTPYMRWPDSHEEAVATGYFDNQPAQSKEYTDRIIQSLSDLAGRIERTMGEDNFFAQYIKEYVTALQNGIFTPQDVLQSLRGFFSVFQSGLFQEMNSPDRALRELANALFRFINGGQLP